MRDALAPATVQSLYNGKASRYDWQHGLLTLHSDAWGRRMVVERGVRAGDHVLDAGGGTGNTAMLAAERVGPTGRVVVVDLSPGMLAEARRKADAAGLAERFQCVEGDMLALPFPDGHFDAVLSTYSACPLTDPVAGIKELYRVVRPGGRLAVAHSTEPTNALLRLLASAVESVAWRFPWLSMGCRPVTTLPALLDGGAVLVEERHFGVPLWPFLFYVVEKPA